MRALVVVPVLLCTSCSSLPSKDDIDAFSSATSSSAAVVTAAVTSSQQLASAQDEQIQALRYVRGRSFSAATIPEAPEVKRLDEAQLEIRLAALRDLQSYAKALGQAADQGAIDKLESAAQSLGSSVAVLATAVNPAMSPIAAPALQLSGRIIGYAFADSYVQHVLRIVQHTDPVIHDLVELFKKDLGPLPTDLWVQATTYAGMREAQLATIRHDRQVDRSRLYDSYMQARSDIRSKYALSEAASSVNELLQSIYDTHHALAVGKADVSLTIKRMTDLTKDAATVIKSAKKDAGQ